MAVGVVRADLDRGDLRPQAGQKVRQARIVAAVVGDLHGVDLGQVKRVASAGPGLSATVSGTPRGEPIFPPMYIQGAGVGLLMILGAGLTWWLVGVRQPTVEFLIATDGEMKKVNWSTRKDVTASTWVVVMWSVLLAGGLFAIDFLFSQFFKLIGVLQS